MKHSIHEIITINETSYNKRVKITWQRLFIPTENKKSSFPKLRFNEINMIYRRLCYCYSLKNIDHTLNIKNIKPLLRDLTKNGSMLVTTTIIPTISLSITLLPITL